MQGCVRHSAAHTSSSLPLTHTHTTLQPSNMAPVEALAEALADARGHRVAAMRQLSVAYTAFAAQWQPAEPQTMPATATVLQRATTLLSAFHHHRTAQQQARARSAAASAVTAPTFCNVVLLDSQGRSHREKVSGDDRYGLTLGQTASAVAGSPQNVVYVQRVTMAVLRAGAIQDLPEELLTTTLSQPARWLPARARPVDLPLLAEAKVGDAVMAVNGTRIAVLKGGTARDELAAT